MWELYLFFNFLSRVMKKFLKHLLILVVVAICWVAMYQVWLTTNADATCGDGTRNEWLSQCDCDPWYYRPWEWYYCELDDPGFIYYGIGLYADPSTWWIVEWAWSYEESQVATISATPNTWYVFSGWRWNGNSSRVLDNPYIFEVWNDEDFTAYFTYVGEESEEWPDRQAIYTALGSALWNSGVSNNFDYVTNENVSNFPNLSFWTSYGMITFQSGIDLTSPDTQSFLQALGNAIDMTGDYISFNPLWSGVALNIPAKLEFRPSSVPFMWIEPAKDFIIARDADDNLLSNEARSGLLSDSRLYCDRWEWRYCNLWVNHFTSFEIFNSPAPWILPYNDGNPPTWFIKLVDNINNPQYMVYMRQNPIDNNGGGFTYTQMQSYTPNENEAIPSTALMNILTTSNHTTTRVAESGIMNDQGNWSDRVYDATEIGVWQYGTEYNLMTVDGGLIWDSSVSGPYFVANSFNTASNHIRTIYTTTDFVPLVPFSCDLVTDVSTWECNALVDLYNETDGGNWSFNGNDRAQDNDTTACDWYGISCNEWHVVWIELEEVGMNGTIPNSISGLVYLQSFNIYGNAITAFPESIGELSNLTNLEFSDNQISILPDSITQLTWLTSLYGYGNILTELPEDIGNLVNLQELDVDSNYLISLPESIGNLHNLRLINVYSNNITWLPESMTGMTSLQYFYVNQNCIDENVWSDEFVAFVDNIENVDYWEQDYCPSENIEESDFAWWFYWNNILFYDHLGTGVTFTTDNTWADFTLKDGASKENFLYLPIFGTTIFSASSIRDGILFAPTYVSNPDYGTGWLPAERTGLTSNEILNTVQLWSWTTSLSTNGSWFTVYVRIPATDEMAAWEIIHIYRSEDRYHWIPNTPDATCEPSEWWCTFTTDQTSYFTFVREFTFSCDNVADISTGECNALVDLYTATDGDNRDDNSNWFTSNYACTWNGVDCKWGSTVRWLILKNNYLSGAIPESFGDLVYLNRVNVQYNNITSIPTSIGNLSSINVLVLDHNNLTSIPASISGLVNLGQLSLWYNQLTSLPDSMGDLHNLQRLFIDNNRLTTLPDTMTSDNLPYMNSYYFRMYNNCIWEWRLSSGVNEFIDGMEIDRWDQETNCPSTIVHTDSEGAGIWGSAYIYEHTSTWATFTEDGLINLVAELPEDYNNYLTFSTNGFIINVVGGNWDGVLYAPQPTFTNPELGERNLPNASEWNTTRTIVTTVSAWASWASLSATWWYFTIKLHMDESYSWQTLHIYRSSDGWISRQANTPDATCEVLYSEYNLQWVGQSRYTCEFRTDHLSYFTTVAETTSQSTPTGWGAGWWTLSKDICPNGDFSSSFYDGKCGTSTTLSWATSWASNELLDAYIFAHDLGITSASSFADANMEWLLLRSHLAKMMVNYATKVLSLKPDTNKVCEFDDVANENAELQWYMKLACQLWIMGINPDGSTKQHFDPNSIVTRAEFGTVLSRLLRWDKYNNGVLYYTDHLQALKDAGIMTNISNPERTKELRGWVMLMLMRTDK